MPHVAGIDVKGSNSNRSHWVVPAVFMLVVVVLRLVFHPPAVVHPAIVPEVPDSWWAGIFHTHDWLLHGYDEGEWFGLVNAYLDGTTSHVTRPPAYPILAAGLALIVGHRVLAMHLVAHLVSLLVCLATYVLGSRLANRFVGVGAGLIVATAPRIVSVQDGIGPFPVLLLATVTLALVSLRTAGRPGWIQGLFLGLAAAFALTAHYTSAFFVLPAGLLVLFVAGRAGLVPLVVAAVVAAGLAGGVYGTVPAQPVHSGGVSVAKFYEHALNHPDGRNLDLAPDPVGPGTRRQPVLRPGIFTADGPVGRTIIRGPAAVYRSMTAGYGPAGVAPLVMGLMLIGIGWPSDEPRSGRLGRWHPGLWLLGFLAVLLYAAPALADMPDHRYLSFAVPFAAVAFMRGLDRVARLIGRRVRLDSRWSPALAVIPLGLVLAFTSATITSFRPPHRDVQVQRHVLATQIRNRFGTGGYIVSATGQMGSGPAYAALTRRTICSLGAGDGICLDGHTVRESLSECAEALLAACHDGNDTPYLIDIEAIHRIRDPFTVALNEVLSARFERVVTRQYGNHTVQVIALDESRLRALAAGAR